MTELCVDELDRESNTANPDEYVDNLIRLSYLNEPAILRNLNSRYNCGKIYTNAGPILIAINPLKKLPLYTPEVLRIYRRKLKHKLDPHVYLVADNAYEAMVTDGMNQSIIISGESGAGKTETAKVAMQYIAALGGGLGVENEILQTNPILEAFGNAKTLRNNNSSRFGKLIDIHFDNAGKICGAKIQTYLLEKSRVVHQTEGERSYHIFYQLCAGADSSLRTTLNLKPAQDYYYLSQSGCLTIERINDVDQFRNLVHALNTVRVSRRDQIRLFEMLAAVLWIGNIKFVAADSDRNVTAENDEAIKSVAALLQCESNSLVTALCSRQLHIGGESITQKLTFEQASDARDALAKALYSNLFDWLVDKINTSLCSEKSYSGKVISILDIYGFESFIVNGFEQLCINYANERLQQHFNQHLFKIEQQVYSAEGIDWTRVEFVDNQECLDLIEKKPLGLFALLDEECTFPKATDVSLTFKLNEHLKGVNCFASQRSGFSVGHYAGKVTYATVGMLEKNRDLLHADLLQLLGSCGHYLPRLFAVTAIDNANSKKSAAAKFKGQLMKLMQRLETTSPHFIRCVKPNQKQLANVFDGDVVLQQLRCCGVCEVVRISRSGYPTRYLHSYFANRFGFLLGTEIDGKDELSICVSVLQRLCVTSDEHQVGLNRLFFRAGQGGKMEEQRARTLAAIARFQNYFRGRKIRNQYLRLLNATIYLQSLARRMMSRRMYEERKRKHVAAMKIQKYAKSMKLKKMHSAALVIQRRVRERMQHRRFVAAIIVLQKHFRTALIRQAYLRTRRRILLLQAAVRGWMVRKAMAEEDGDYVKVSVVDVELGLEERCMLEKMNMEIERKVRENAELAAKVEEYEWRWREYEERLNAMEKGWQRRMFCLEESLEAAKRCLEEEEDDDDDDDDEDDDEMMRRKAKRKKKKKKKNRGLKPMLPDEEDDAEVETRYDDVEGSDDVSCQSRGHVASRNDEVEVERRVVSELRKELEYRSEVFRDDVEFIVEVKCGEVDAELDPEMELRKLKQRFDVWKREFKVRLRETKFVLEKVEKKKKWWGVKRS